MSKLLEQQYDRFNLEEEIQKVWNTEEDLDTILYRIMDAKMGLHQKMM